MFYLKKKKKKGEYTEILNCLKMELSAATLLQ